MAGTYARELAARGIISLAFDFTGWGESVDGVSEKNKYIEDPVTKTADILAAVKYMSSREDVDKPKISGLESVPRLGIWQQRQPRILD